MYIGLHVKNFLMKLEFSRQAVEKYSNMKLMKIPPVEHSFSMRIDGRTDGRKDRPT
jgi:hypothetical protein